MDQKSSSKQSSRLASALAIAFELGFTIAIPIILFLLLGQWIDGMLHTSPLFLIIGIIIGTITAFVGVVTLVQVFLDETT